MKRLPDAIAADTLAGAAAWNRNSTPVGLTGSLDHEDDLESIRTTGVAEDSSAAVDPG
jgi:hypothetical protein